MTTNDNGESLPRNDQDAFPAEVPLTPEQRAQIAMVLRVTRRYVEANPELLPAGDPVDDDETFQKILSRDDDRMPQWRLEGYARDAWRSSGRGEVLEAAGIEPDRITELDYWSRIHQPDPRVRRALEILAVLGQLGDPTSIVGTDEEEAAWLVGTLDEAMGLSAVGDEPPLSPAGRA